MPSVYLHKNLQKKNSWLKLACPLVMCLTLLLVTVSPNLGNASTSPAKVSVLEVLKTPNSSLISVHANNIYLDSVIKEISRVTGMVFKTMKSDLMKEPVEVNLSDVRLQEVLAYLLQNYSKVFLQNDSGDLVKVLILDKNTDTPQPLFANKIESEPKLDTSKSVTPTTRAPKPPVAIKARLEGETPEVKKTLFTQKREELDKKRVLISIPQEVSERLANIRPGYPIPDELENDPELIGYMQEYGLESLYDLSYIGRPRGIVMRSNQNRRRFLPPPNS
ncbi:MAG: hypothetical protein COV66_07005 [Nitrospinae bacterium CG11_big_fil_rev_8_21_14_0_20_45_15]|nr:MAG: hypothetical protein COV66_07005 [Nitrospinae bacterium CG11_big_fil_rev_8_21_14_0_20_45_15]